MDIVIDFNPIIDFFSLPPHIFLWALFWNIGWIPIAIAFLWGAAQVWLRYVRIKWYLQQKFVLLAIDIPRGNEQTPKAVENMFTYLAGAHGTFNLFEKWWEGKFQLSFSYEIVSIDGYTQFLIRAPAQFRDLIESSVYSQYPDAEITEVNDYTEGMPSKFPDEEYDIWGCEFVQKENSAYPIKVYKEFEHQMGATETQYKDPMATLMDLYSSLRKGEQIWFQIILIPIGFDWPEIGDKEISKILGETVEVKKDIFDKLGDTVIKWIGDFSEFIYKLWGDIEEKDKEQQEDAFKIMNLKPKEKKQIEAIQNKVSKLGFEAKFRFVYVAKKEVMNKPKALNGFVGFIKQFACMDLNNLKPDLEVTATKANYFLKDYRINIKKNKIMQAYKSRDDSAGRNPGIFNIEELASIWHFPIESVVKAPLIQKAPGRKAEPPMSLPIGEEIVSEELLEPIFEETAKEDNQKQMDMRDENRISDIKGAVEFGKETGVKGAPPANLPFA